MKFILSGGGTGGHVYPAIAIAEQLKEFYGKSGVEFLYIGIRGRAEEKIVSSLGYNIRYVTSEGLSGRKKNLMLLLAAFKIGIGVLQALSITLRFRPDAVIGTGGYASVPAILAVLILRRLNLLKTKIFIHEQNYAPGRWNRMIARWADRFWITFDGTSRFLPGANLELTGYPIRQQIKPLDKAKARKTLNIPSEAKVVLAFGGSQGARTINRAIIDALPLLLKEPNLEVYHGTGMHKSDYYDAVKDTAKKLKSLNLPIEEASRYHPQEYINDIHNYYAAADIVVCRAGAGTLNELCRCGRPALVIPKSNLAGEHQAVNAITLARAGACEVIFEHPVFVGTNLEAEVDGGFLADRIIRLLSDENALETMSQAALGAVAVTKGNVFAKSVDSVLKGTSLSRAKLSATVVENSDNVDLVKLSHLSPHNLLAYLTRLTSDKNPEWICHYSNVELMRCFTDAFLVNPRWQIRNIGVKMVGLTYHVHRRDMLLTLAGDRSPAPLWRRIFHNDFKQVGFIRRNAMVSLARLGLWDEKLRELLLSALTEDPYYEVRVQAAQLIIQLGDKIGACEKLTGALVSNLSHHSLEVRWCCLEALGSVAKDSSFIDHCENCFLHPNWRIRQALLNAASKLLERSLLRADSDFLKKLELLIPTCTDFTPSFPLKRSLNRIQGLRQANNAGVDRQENSKRETTQ